MLIALGLKIVEFRSHRINLRVGDAFWVASGLKLMDWDTLLASLEMYHVRIAELQRRLSIVFGVPSMVLREDNYSTYFPTGVVVGRVQVVSHKASQLSVFHMLNPDPKTWTVALELQHMCILPRKDMVPVKGALPWVFYVRWAPGKRCLVQCKKHLVPRQQQRWMALQKSLFTFDDD